MKMKMKKKKKKKKKEKKMNEKEWVTLWRDRGTDTVTFVIACPRQKKGKRKMSRLDKRLPKSEGQGQ